MSNKYGISEEELRKVRMRDKTCVYCHRKMKAYLGTKGTPGDKATIEHLNYQPPWDNPKTVAICCGRCNSSRNNKKLLDWFKTLYCIKNNINENTVAEVVKNFIRTNLTS